MKYNYTIIIPHKNSVDVLRRCLNSIPQRDDLHVIVIDDNSDPKIVDFDKFPGKERADVTLIFDKESKGAGHARNRGLELLDTKWVLFSDCDDFFSDNLNQILDGYVNCTDDIVFFDVESVYSDTLKPSTRSLSYNKRLNKAIRENDMNLLRYKFIVPWGKIVRAEIIKNYSIFFDEYFVSNDAMFSLKTGHYARSVSAVKKVLYVVTTSSNSLMTQRALSCVWTRFNVAININQFLSKNKLSKYHVNLLAYLDYFRGKGLRNICKAIIKSIRYTPPKYLIGDFCACVKYFFSKTQR